MKHKMFFQTLGFVLAVGLTLVLTTSVFAADTTRWMKAKVMWPVKPNACKYHVMYREKGASHWQHALRNIPATQQNGTTWRDVEINYLIPGKQYEAQVNAYICSMKSVVPMIGVEALKLVSMK
jgi:hypothetical protein